MIAVAAVVGLVVVLLACGVVLGLGAADPAESMQVAAEQPVERSRFFVVRTDAPGVPAGEVPLELIVSRLEEHVRRERAAVALFHDQPSPDSLRCRTSSPLAAAN